MANAMVLIRNSAGLEYAVYPASFEHAAHTTYRGFKIVSWEDGSRYEGPKTASALDKAHDEQAQKSEKSDKSDKGR